MRLGWLARAAFVFDITVAGFSYNSPWGFQRETTFCGKPKG
jgi:hypothetical protein